MQMGMELGISPAQKEINGSWDAIQHYKSLAGGVVPAGEGLYRKMREDASYIEKVKGNHSVVAGKIRDNLSKVPTLQNSGSFSNAPNSSVGLWAFPIGSYELKIFYTAHWTATNFEPRWYSMFTGNCYREVSTTVTVRYTLIESWDFEDNTEIYGHDGNFFEETLPSAALGRGKPFQISGKLFEIYELVVDQKL